MTSISGKTDIDWAAFAAALAPVEVIDEPVVSDHDPVLVILEWQGD